MSLFYALQKQRQRHQWNGREKEKPVMWYTQCSIERMNEHPSSNYLLLLLHDTAQSTRLTTSDKEKTEMSHFSAVSNDAMPREEHYNNKKYIIINGIEYFCSVASPAVSNRHFSFLFTSNATQQTHIIFICVSRAAALCERVILTFVGGIYFPSICFYCLAVSGFAMRAISFDLFFSFHAQSHVRLNQDGIRHSNARMMCDSFEFSNGIWHCI